MNQTPLLAVLVGLAIGVALVRFAVGSTTALVVGLVYTGAAYFVLASDRSLLEASPDFEGRAATVAYGIGVFALSVSPLAFGRRTAGGDLDPVFVVWLAGVIAFLEFARSAAE
ncbi:hypothetical protein [Saliphagus infecundisoli]|uniref:Uncharacterized protein n=1 Tax=Saliphagus infecundisoli TaxID=1849069 RepID=A0ABD5QGH1_9EURY|nr:hypothetical protein [Saliphagus infecundisoli]